MENTFSRIAILCFLHSALTRIIVFTKSLGKYGRQFNIPSRKKTLELLSDYFKYHYWISQHNFEENRLSLKIQKECADLSNDLVLELDFFNKLQNEIELGRRKEFIGLF